MILTVHTGVQLSAQCRVSALYRARLPVDHMPTSLRKYQPYSLG